MPRLSPGAADGHEGASDQQGLVERDERGVVVERSAKALLLIQVGPVRDGGDRCRTDRRPQRVDDTRCGVHAPEGRGEQDAAKGDGDRERSGDGRKRRPLRHAPTLDAVRGDPPHDRPDGDGARDEEGIELRAPRESQRDHDEPRGVPHAALRPVPAPPGHRCREEQDERVVAVEARVVRPDRREGRQHGDGDARPRAGLADREANQRQRRAEARQRRREPCLPESRPEHLRHASLEVIQHWPVVGRRGAIVAFKREALREPLVHHLVVVRLPVVQASEPRRDRHGDEGGEHHQHAAAGCSSAGLDGRHTRVSGHAAAPCPARRAPRRRCRRSARG